METEKFSKDPKVYLISLSDMVNKVRCFTYPKLITFTQSLISFKVYKGVLINFGTEEDIRIDYVYVAYRNGIDEYNHLDKAIKDAENKLKDKKTVGRKEKVEQLLELKKSMPAFKPYCPNQSKNCFNESLTQTNYKSGRNDANKYVVLDVETNGLSSKVSDLLSISILDPVNGVCYNRFLPLENQPCVYTTLINGIDTNDLSAMHSINQEEVDQIISFFNLKNRIILQYSGNKLFDKQFIDQYFIKHKITGNESFNWFNIKSLVPAGLFAYQGSVTKDNLCNIFGIEGVTKIHSGINDCLLEWKLFEKMSQIKPIEIRGTYYEYNPEYVIPVSVLYQNKKLFEYSNVPQRKFIGHANPIFSQIFEGEEIKNIKKYETNISGISLERIIYSSLNVQFEDNADFLIPNRRKLKFIGSLISSYDEIPISFDEDGLVIALNEKDKKFINEVNKTSLLIKNMMEPLLSFIKNDIFESKPIKSQELVIGEDGKVLALCDLSNDKRVLEIKTYGLNVDENGKLRSDYEKAQLFYQSRGRDTYYLTIEFKQKHIDILRYELESIKFTVYKIDINECTEDEYEIEKNKLDKAEDIVWNYAKKHPGCNSMDIVKEFNASEEVVKFVLKYLVKKGYVKRPRRYLSDPWVLLK